MSSSVVTDDDDDAVHAADESSVPIGYKFAPTDEELIVHYLAKKILNESLPSNKIKVVNLYDYDPEALIEKYKVCGEKEKEWYFFTHRRRKYPNGRKLPNRNTADGYWKATVGETYIFGEDDDKRPVGSKRTLVYYKGKASTGKSLKTNYIMYEYIVDFETLFLTKKRRTVSESPNSECRTTIDNMKLDDWVLCRIHLNQRNSSPSLRAKEYHRRKPIRRSLLKENEEEDDEEKVELMADSLKTITKDDEETMAHHLSADQFIDSNAVVDQYLAPALQYNSNNDNNQANYTDQGIPTGQINEDQFVEITPTGYYSSCNNQQELPPADNNVFPQYSAHSDSEFWSTFIIDHDYDRTLLDLSTFTNTEDRLFDE